MVVSLIFTNYRSFKKEAVISGYKSTLAGRVCNWQSSPLLAFWHIDVTMRHQIAGVEQAANHTDRSLLQL